MDLSYSESIVINHAPEDLYDMVSDVTRMGEWSPICAACWWDEGNSASVGSWFTGRNETPERTWETRSLVVVAERGREFTFVVGGALIKWAYIFEPVASGTLVTESWEVLPDGIAFFAERYGNDADTEMASRAQAARSGIPVTLAKIKQRAEEQ